MQPLQTTRLSMGQPATQTIGERVRLSILDSSFAASNLFLSSPPLLPVIPPHKHTHHTLTYTVTHSFAHAHVHSLNHSATQSLSHPRRQPTQLNPTHTPNIQFALSPLTAT